MSTPRSLMLLLALGTSLSLSACGRKKAPPAEEGQPPPAEAAAASGETDGNRPPVVTTVTVSPADPRTGDDITLQADASDPDGDSINFTYQWYINGAQALGEIDSTLRANKTQHGDRVAVEVTPHDGKTSGDVRRSGEILVLNSAPKLKNDFKGGVSLDGYRLLVSDPDDDPITFEMTGAPPNMSIDADGTIHWKPRPDDQAGDYEVTVIAADGQGGNVTVKFPVKVNPPRGPQPPGN